MVAPQYRVDVFHHQMSKHAVDRFLERGEREWMQMPRNGVSLILDSRIDEAMLAGKYDTVIDRDAPAEQTRVVEITARKSVQVMVVMRPLKSREHSHVPLAGTHGEVFTAITVLTMEMATQCYDRGKWVSTSPIPAEKIENRPLAKLAIVKSALAPVQPPTEPTGTAAKVSSAKRPRGGTNAERRDFLAALLAGHPDTNYPNAYTAALKEFGVGISVRVFKDVQEKLGGIVKAPAETAVPAPVAPTSARATPPPSASSTGLELTDALAAERAARDAKVAADRALAAATHRVEALLSQMQKERLA